MSKRSNEQMGYDIERGRDRYRREKEMKRRKRAREVEKELAGLDRAFFLVQLFFVTSLFLGYLEFLKMFFFSAGLFLLSLIYLIHEMRKTR